MGEELFIHGDFSSPQGRIFKIQFERCDPTERSTCRSDEEVTQWLNVFYLGSDGQSMTRVASTTAQKLVEEASKLAATVETGNLKPIVHIDVVQSVPVMTGKAEINFEQVHKYSSYKQVY